MWLHPFLTSALGGDEWWDWRFGRSTPGESTPTSSLGWSWVGVRDCLDALEKRELSLPYGNRTAIPLLSNPWPVHYSGTPSERRTGVGLRSVRSRPDCRLSSVAEQTRLTCSPLADHKSDGPGPCSYVTCLYNSVQDWHPRPYRSPSGLPDPPWQPAASTHRRETDRRFVTLMFYQLLRDNCLCFLV